MMRVGRLRLLLVVVALGWNFVFAIHFLADPLGRSPVLDARENAAWAQWIAEGTMPEEPFYRALLYPWVLSRFLIIGVSEGMLPWVGSFLGVVCHLVTALCVGRLAWRIWGAVGAGWTAGWLWAMYPVGQYFSVMLLDVTFATALFMLALVLAIEALARSRSRNAAVGILCGAGLLVGLAVLARPHCLPPALMLPWVVAWLAWRGARNDQGSFFQGAGLIVPAAAVFLPFVVVMLGHGWLNQRVSGEFRILPWQGAYNLYAANNAAANGRYLVQTINFMEIPEGQNPTRMESEYRYRMLAGSEAPQSVDAMNAFWRERVFTEIGDDPLRWLGLKVRKVFYLLNHWEQYNNLTYAFHRERFLMLVVNPLGWGVLLLAAVLAVVLASRRLNRESAFALLVLAAAYTAGLLMFFVSARFRIPLAPLMMIFVGGGYWVVRDRLWSTEGWRLQTAVAAVLLVAAITFPNWFGARDRSTFVQDRFLLASASQRVGDDAQAYQWAAAVLDEDPHRDDARRIQALALFNQWLPGQGAADERRAFLYQRVQETILQFETDDASTAFIRGVIAWRRGDRDEAKSIWQEAKAQHEPEQAVWSMIALDYTHGNSLPEQTKRVISRMLTE